MLVAHGIQWEVLGSRSRPASSHSRRPGLHARDMAGTTGAITVAVRLSPTVLSLLAGEEARPVPHGSPRNSHR